MHGILASGSALFKSSFLFIQSVPTKFKNSRPVQSRPVQGDFAPPPLHSDGIYSLMASRLARPRADSPTCKCMWVRLALCVGAPGENISVTREMLAAVARDQSVQLRVA